MAFGIRSKRPFKYMQDFNKCFEDVSKKFESLGEKDLENFSKQLKYKALSIHQLKESNDVYALLKDKYVMFLD